MLDDHNSIFAASRRKSSTRALRELLSIYGRAMLALLAMAQLTNGLDLASHLRALGAPRAAQRLDGIDAPAAPTPFVAQNVRLVADAAAAAAFSADVSEAAAIALDCEWRQ